MPYRPENELKRPDLKGEFLCGHCGKTFCHAASLNRHRLNFHGDDQKCLVCNKNIPQLDTVRRHMLQEHNIQRVFTCGCCNWTFPDKKELHSHNNSMSKHGEPGNARAIAVSGRVPGSLSQHELRGVERTPKPRRRAAKQAELQDTSLSGDNDQFMALMNLLAAQQTLVPSQQTVPAAFLAHLAAQMPVLLPFMQATQSPSPSAASTSSASETEEPSVLDTMLAGLMVNNNQEGPSTSASTSDNVAEEENVEDGKTLLLKAVGIPFLSVTTEQQASLSESGIGTNSPSPVSLSSTSDHVSPTSSTQRKTKKSIDDICFGLRKNQN